MWPSLMFFEKCIGKCKGALKMHMVIYKCVLLLNRNVLAVPSESFHLSWSLKIRA